MYKDKDKQREANRQAQARFKAKGITKQGITLPKETDLGNTQTTTQTVGAAIPKRGKDIKCFEDLPPDVQKTIDRMSIIEGKLDKEEKAKRTAAAIKYQHLFPNLYEPTTLDQDFTRLLSQAGPGHVRVSKPGDPGDPDYVPMCETTRKFTRPSPPVDGGY